MNKILLRVFWSYNSSPTQINEDFQVCDNLQQAQYQAKIYQEYFDRGSNYCFTQIRLYKLEPVEL